MRNFVIGLVLAIVILAGGFLVPALLQSSATRDALAARRQAELARRELHAYDPLLPRLAQRTDLPALKAADTEKLAAGAGEAGQAAMEEITKLVNRAQALDRKTPLPDSELRAVRVDAAGLRSAVGSFETAAKNNEAILAQAAKDAREAGQTDSSAIGVGDVNGLVQMTQARWHLAQARDLRRQLGQTQTQALRAAAQWADTRAWMDHYGGLDGKPIRASLSEDQKEIEQLAAEASAEAEELKQQIAEREQKLATARATLTQAGTELLNVQELGFRPGDDTSFAAYRDKYQQLSKQLGEAQRQEQLLTRGGRQGGQPTGDEVEIGPVEGGEPYHGLEELQRRLEVANARIEHFASAKEALAAKAKAIETFDQAGKRDKDRYAKQLAEAFAEFEKTRTRMEELATAAIEAEDAALQSAKAAADAFAKAANAVRGWTGQAAQLQRSKDPERKNDRLKMIVADQKAEQAADTGQAEAKALIGQIQAERAVGLSNYAETLDAATAIIRGATYEAKEPLKEAIDTARTEAATALNEAKELLTKLAQRDPKTAWVSQAALAAVAYDLARIDPLNAEKHRADATDAITKAAVAEKTPYFRDAYRQLYALLTGGEAAGGTSQPAETEGTTPSETPSGG